jgi:NTE family protein
MIKHKFWRVGVLILILPLYGDPLVSTGNPGQASSAILKQATETGAPVSSAASGKPLQLTDPDMKIGLALGGGAAKGLAHIGVLKALEEAGIQVDFIAGSSMGALIGAAYAAGTPIDTIEQIARQTDWKDLAMLFDPTIPAYGFLNGERVKRFLERFYGGRKIEELAIPYAATATDISTGREYIIDHGDLLSAVRTSISIPVVFTPQQYGDLVLVDGGLVDPVPIEAVRRLGADFVIAVNVLVPPDISAETDPTAGLNADNIQALQEEGWFPIGRKKKEGTPSDPPNLIQIMHRTVMISMAQLARSRVELEQPDLLIEPWTADIRAWDFQRSAETIDRGYQAARKALEQFQAAAQAAD